MLLLEKTCSMDKQQIWTTESTGRSFQEPSIVSLGGTGRDLFVDGELSCSNLLEIMHRRAGFRCVVLARLGEYTVSEFPLPIKSRENI